MAGNLTALAVILLGAGSITTGLLLYLSSRGFRHLKKRPSKLETRLLAITMVLLGSGLALTGWLISPRVGQTPADINTLLEQAPTAAGPKSPPIPHLNSQSLLLLIWGTPSDDGDTSDQQEMAYAYAIGNDLARLLRSKNPDLKVETILVSKQEQVQAGLSPSVTLEWCKKGEWGMIAVIGLAAPMTDDVGYVPWREPQYVFRDCESADLVQLKGRVMERPGDAFPYQQGLEREFLQALGRFTRDKG